MEMPVLLFDPDVDNFGSRMLEIESGETITYEEAFQNPIYKKKALQINPTDSPVPIEFTMFVLRKMAVREKDFRSFKKALPSEAFDYFRKLLGHQYHKRNQWQSVHPPCTRDEKPSTFRGILTKIFCKKLISNLNNQEDTHYDKLVIVFPFRVYKTVSDPYDLEVLDILDEAFYKDLQIFLDEHFDNENARGMCNLFLNNVHRHFIDHAEFDDYLTTFPRLNRGGIEWFTFLYSEYNEVQESFKMNAPLSPEKYNEEHFQKLPETNFDDLYAFLDPAEFRENRQVYSDKFKKYLFFFIHASKVDSNPIFVIDDLLFECSKSLHRYKTLKEDIKMLKDLANMTMLHLREKPDRRNRKRNSADPYYIRETALKNIKRYLLNRIENKNARLNVKYKTDLLTWMPYRTSDTCLNICYSARSGVIKDFGERVLCSILCPENEPIRYIVGYNAYEGVETKFVLPENIDSLKNFVKLCNTYDVTEEPLDETIDDFMRKFYKLTETEQDRRLAS